MRPGRRGPWPAVQGGAGDVPAPDQEDRPGAAVGDQSLPGSGAGAQRRRSGQHPLLELPFVVVKQRLEDTRPGAEPAEDGALAQSRPFRQPVHRQPGGALLREHLAGGGQQAHPVARGIGALGERRSPVTGSLTESLYGGIRTGV